MTTKHFEHRISWRREGSSIQTRYFQHENAAVRFINKLKEKTDSAPLDRLILATREVAPWNHMDILSGGTSMISERTGTM